MAHATVILLALLAGSDVDADERVAIFPGYGYRAVDSDQWRVYTHGVVYEPEEDSATRRLAYRLLRDRLALKPDSSEARRLRRRVTQIFVDHESGQLISIRPGDVESNVVTLGPTGDDGHVLVSERNVGLSTRIQSPCHQRPVGLQRNAVVAPGGNGDEVVAGRHIGLAVAIITPTHQRPVLPQRQPVCAADRHGYEIVARGHLLGERTQCAPRPQHACGQR